MAMEAAESKSHIRPALELLTAAATRLKRAKLHLVKAGEDVAALRVMETQVRIEQLKKAVERNNRL